jgi:parallel beta-helix repeat protein
MRTCTVALALFALAHPVLGQGNLAPPGAPNASMKTLNQVEPRMDLLRLPGTVQSEVAVAAAGSYYLSRNLEVGKSNGLHVLVDDVTIDLNGFQVIRVSGSGGNGISIGGGIHRATVRNGTIRGFGYGIRCYPTPDYAKSCLFENLTVSDCATYGLFGGTAARVIDCAVSASQGIGIQVEHGSLVRGCTLHGIQGYGIWAKGGCAITRCSAYDNRGGFAIYADIGSVISECSVYNNESTQSPGGGISIGNGGQVVACAVRSTTTTNEPVASDGAIGIYAFHSAVVRDCTAVDNMGDGIRVGSRGLIVGNLCAGNGSGAGDGAGIHATSSRNRIEANDLTFNDRGIHAEGQDNLVARNSAGSNATNYVLVANNKVGPIVSAPNSGPISGTTGGAGLGSTDPWANFSY